VNLETDVIGKYVEKLASPHMAATNAARHRRRTRRAR
jgi:riboflavin synthase alpha subunit